MVSSLKPLRSLLFAPGNDAGKLQKVGTAGADAVALDLEDAVPLTEKERARVITRDALVQAGSQGSDVFVRINPFPSDLAKKDLEVVVRDGLSGVLVPKVESAEHMGELDSTLDRLERERNITNSLRILPILETAKGVLQSYTIASATSRVQAVVFGAEDLTMDMGVKRTAEGGEVAHARSHIVLSATAAGVPAIDSVYTSFRDSEGLIKDAEFARSLGYKGKLAIHPGQVAPVNRVFSPSEEDVTQAKRVMEAYQAASDAGRGVAVLDGKMLDPPIVERAKKLISLYEAVQAESG